MKKQFQKYPRYTADQRPFLYYISSDGMDMTEVPRTAFLELVHSVPDPIDHIFIDYESGLGIFFGETSSVASVLTFSRRDFNREAKRRERAHQCVLKGTMKCDGWKPDANGFIRCENCTRCQTARTISLDAPQRSDDDDDPVMMDFPTEDEALTRLFEQADKAVLQDALAALPEADREYLLARYQPGMTARKLAERYGIVDYRYANRKAQRILDRVIRCVKKSEE